MKNRSWKLANAQSLADEFPYTFHKPSDEVVSQLKVGNQAKLIFEFESVEPEDPSAERMWVEITSIDSGVFSGYLDNDPAYIQDIKYKDLVEFRDFHIIDTDLADPVPATTDQYLKRCYVTNNILYGGELVGYLYREAPDREDDSGWRFTTGSESDEYMSNADNLSYVSLGAVLRQDDSFLSLLERKEGAAFAKGESDVFVALED